MSKFLIIYAHPSREGHCGYFLEQIENKLKKQATDYELIDLYQLNYNPVLKNEELYSSGRKAISEENLALQAKIKGANRLLFIYPTWWQNVPAILKGFLDRIFTGGFGVTYKHGLPIGLLKGKRAAAFTTCSGPSVYTHFFTGSSSLKVLLKHTLKFCGMQTKGFLFGSARHLEENKGRLEKMSGRVIKYLA
ncbi:MAG: NAD(P)H-dependent oxidoreductase [Patescibacteria group bacterium]|nr:NAD(P)H-dependent oxidoreductase [Patescibacteria group bacterium]